MIDKAQAALDLWERLFAMNYNPWQNNDYGGTFCVFCYEDHPNHWGDCVYIAVTKLFGYEPVIKIGY